MIINYFTLRALSSEFNDTLGGATILDVFTQQKNELTLSISRPPGKGEGKADCGLIVCVDPKLCYVTLRDRVTRARKNSVNLLQDLVGSTIEHISMRLFDRTIIVKCSRGMSLFLQLYNTIASNIFLVDEQKTVREAFKNNKELKGTRVDFPAPRFDPAILDDPQCFTEAMESNSSRTALAAVKQTMPILGTTFSREALYRAHVMETTRVGDLPEEAIAIIREEIRRIIREVERPSPRIYYDVYQMAILSILPLAHLESFELETFSSVNAAIQRRIINAFKEERGNKDKEELLERIRKELNRAEHGKEKSTMRVKEGDDPQYFERVGNILLTHLTEFRKGMKEIVLTDLYSGTTSIQIQLDPTLSPVENAERYFEKAKKRKLAIEESLKRRRELEGKISNLRTLEKVLARSDTKEEIKEFHREYDQELRGMKFIRNTPGEEQPPFRMFIVVGGFEVWVGKSGANNDLLTMKYAKPNDLWFHVRGASGSHTVLKVKSNAQPVSKEAIVQAACIAAYYSKMRKAGNVPVAYCERKYVKKPKGAREGAVTLEREKVIFVKPRLP